MEAKKWWESTTLWGNVIGLVVLVAGFFGLDLGMDEATQAQVVAGILGVFNFINRFRTNSAIGSG